ncbi:MAG: T9SS type A sorting domain-containing protein [Balneolales bacterium]
MDVDAGDWVELNTIHFIDAQTGWAAGQSGTLLYTGDGGQTWHSGMSLSQHAYHSLHFTDAGTGWAAGDGGTLMQYTQELTLISPTLSSPDDGADELNAPPELQWEPVDDATAYRLQISRSYAFNTRRVDTSGITSTLFNPDGLLDDGTWYWRVSGRNEEGTSAWSPVRRFTIAEVTSAQPDPADLPQRFALHHNYPNPFNPATVIRYELPRTSEVRLEVFDLLGRRVATLVDGPVQAGRHEAHFNASRLSSGVYLYRLQAGSTASSQRNDFVQIRRMTVIK